MDEGASARSLVMGAAAFIGGCAFVGAEALYWYFTQRFVLGQEAALTEVSRFYVAVAAGITVAVFGAWLALRALGRMRGEPPDSVWSVLSDTLGSKADVRLGALAGVIYGAAYLLISSILVYQPGVDFGVASPGVVAAACCGAPGTVPELVVYLVPSWHLALQILPVDALFAVVIPILVGFNVAVAAHALRNRMLRANAGWLGPVGIVAGLFTGCPTCAGLFLAGTVGGLGATALAITLAPYQALFIALSIPVLVASPFVTAVFAGRAALAACAVPSSGANVSLENP